MSTDIFPTLPGLSWPIMRSPMTSTTITTAVSGREYRRPNWMYPRYRYQLVFDLLRQNASYNEMQTLFAFITKHLGQWDTWYFDDPDDDTATAQTFGVGTGNLKTFQLIRNFGGVIDPVYALNGNPSIYLNGVLKTVNVDYTLSSTGIVTWTVAPALGVPMTWTGMFYWVCRFNLDAHEFQKTMAGFWEAIQTPIEFITVKP